MITTTFIDAVNSELAHINPNYKVVRQDKTENNGVVKEGLLLTGVETEVAPVVYCRDDMDAYKVADILLMALEDAKKRQGLLANLDADKLCDNIIGQLVPVKGNGAFLEGKAYCGVTDDIVCIFRYVLEASDDGLESIIVTNDMVERFDVSPYDLLTGATRYADDNYTLKSMADFFAGFMGDNFISEDEGLEDLFPPMLILSNKLGVHGASSILSARALHKVHEMLGDFVIIPSSIHEVLCLPADVGESAEDLADMIQSINGEHVAQNEVLGTHAYMCDGMSIWNA